jgi:hypothetical protein
VCDVVVQLPQPPVLHAMTSATSLLCCTTLCLLWPQLSSRGATYSLNDVHEGLMGTTTTAYCTAFAYRVSRSESAQGRPT